MHFRIHLSLIWLLPVHFKGFFSSYSFPSVVFFFFSSLLVLLFTYVLSFLTMLFFVGNIVCVCQVYLVFLQVLSLFSQLASQPLVWALYSPSLVAAGFLPTANGQLFLFSLSKLLKNIFLSAFGSIFWVLVATWDDQHNQFVTVILV